MTAPAAARTGHRSIGLFVGAVVLTIVLDQLTKAWALSALEQGADPRPLLGSLIQLTLVLNPGGALSIGNSTTWVFTIVAAVVVVVVVRLARRLRSRAWAAALGMLLGGAIGNLIDRLFRAPGFPSGHVVDFIDYHVFIGNVADIGIVVAAVGIVVLTFLGIGLDGRRQPRDQAVATTDADEPADEDAAATAGRVADTSDDVEPSGHVDRSA